MRKIQLKSKDEINQMRRPGQVVAQILKEMVELVRPGISTGELDAYAEKRCHEFNVLPAFKGYSGYPASVCISINHEVVHGIPSFKRILQNGDLVGLDFGVKDQGWFADSAYTVAVGPLSPIAQKLLDVTKESLSLGIQQCFPGKVLSDIGRVIQNYVESFGYSVVRDFVGHGIGRALHEEPAVPNYYQQVAVDPILTVGMVLAIEPMVNVGRCNVAVLSDGWTAVTTDRSLSAHFEHTVAITADGPEILTVLDPSKRLKERE